MAGLDLVLLLTALIAGVVARRLRRGGVVDAGASEHDEVEAAHA